MARSDTSKQSLRVVHASPFFDPATMYGGPVTQLKKLCAMLAKRGHKIRVVTTDLGVPKSYPRNMWIDKEGYEIFYARGGVFTPYAPHFTRAVIPPLKQALSEADVLHLCLSFTHLNIHASNLARQYGVPYIYTPRGTLSQNHLKQKQLLKWLFLRIYERRIIRHSSACHAITMADHDALLDQGADHNNINIIPNATDDPKPVTESLVNTFRDLYNIPNNTSVILYVGRIHKYKGIDLLLSAFATLQRQLKNTTLVIAGPEGGCIAQAKRMSKRLGIDSSVKWTGLLENEMREAAYQVADVFALCSRAEGLPNVILEACARGVPVIATEACNLPDIAEYQAGIITSANPEKIAEAMIAMLSKPQYLEVMGKAAQKMIQERFTFDRVVDGVDSMYRSIITD